MNFVWFLVTLAVACLGSFIARKLKLPAGAMVGSMAFVIAFNLITDKGYFYPDLKIVMQIVSGAMIGGKLGREDVKELKTIILPVLILIVMMVILNIAFGTSIYMASELDIATSLFATTPGGVADMALISEELGANTAYVAILQVFRLLIIYTFCPPLFKLAMKKGVVKAAGSGSENKTLPESGKTSEAVQTPEGKAPDNDSGNGAAAPAKRGFEPVRFACLILAAAAIGMLFHFLHVTAGPILGGMVGGAIYTICTRKTLFPKQVTTGLQTVAGAFIGMNMTRESLMNLPELIVPILIMIVGILAFVFITSFLIHKITKLDYATCMFASTPGGLQEMALLAEEMGVNPLKVSVMQTCRLFFVIS
ncbi:MAG: AbrB family transcriptional regulator, partial [Lachnospiraceae bacterium]|nr:AbrB family transcriptional regulator [Lachnospiraceae bacterium]